MLEILLELLLEVVFEVLVQLVLEFGLEVLLGTVSQRKRAHPVLAGVVFLVFGGCLGFLSALVFPDRIFKFRTLPGVSLILSPLLAGLAMQLFGGWRRRRGGTPTRLATFWGGALFALGMAGVRFWMISST